MAEVINSLKREVLMVTIQEITYDQCLTLWNLLWTTRVSPIEPTSAMKLPKFASTREYTNIIGVPIFLGAFMDEQLVGVNSIHLVDEHQMRSRGLFVLPEFRSKGIATKLLKASIARRPADKVLWSYPKEEALPTYVRAGFRCITDRIYDPIEDKWNFYVKA